MNKGFNNLPEVQPEVIEPEIVDGSCGPKPHYHADWRYRHSRRGFALSPKSLLGKTALVLGGLASAAVLAVAFTGLILAVMAVALIVIVPALLFRRKGNVIVRKFVWRGRTGFSRR